jgi:hypothetical protein
MTASLDTPLPGDLPGTGGPSAVGGTVAPPQLSDVDHRIALAFSELGSARSRFAESPSGDGVLACMAAEATVNELLELRLTLTR